MVCLVPSPLFWLGGMTVAAVFLLSSCSPPSPAPFSPSQALADFPGQREHPRDLGEYSSREDLPADYVQVLPRGAMPPILRPTFVRGEKAEIPQDAWVAGVFMNGKARAYSLNLLNGHEVVNDRFGDTAVAVVW